MVASVSVMKISPLRKEAAKKEISEMPETAPALSADEEATAIQKLKDMEKEFEENRGVWAAKASFEILVGTVRYISNI